jgi:hypothetical protein
MHEGGRMWTHQYLQHVNTHRISAQQTHDAILNSPLNEKYSICSKRCDQPRQVSMTFLPSSVLKGRCSIPCGTHNKHVKHVVVFIRCAQKMEGCLHISSAKLKATNASWFNTVQYPSLLSWNKSLFVITSTPHYSAHHLDSSSMISLRFGWMVSLHWHSSNWSIESLLCQKPIHMSKFTLSTFPRHLIPCDTKNS